MGRVLYTLCCGLIFSVFTSCNHPEEKTASFRFFSYSGHDEVFKSSIDRHSQYFNPILCGFYPDPSICRKGDDFFLVNSSFSFYPGIPIFTSKDLVNWRQIGHVLDRPSQLDLNGIPISGGIYAPTIRYNQFNDTFYLVTTCVEGRGSFVVKTKDPYQGWSDPIPLPDVGGIDPSLFFDDDGKAYLVHNDLPEEREWDGHRAIRIHEYDLESDRTFGTSKIIVDGGVDKSTKPVWIEGPHIFKRNGKYLLLCAEGGTGTNHSQVAFTSNGIFGPYTPSGDNPILTQRDLPENRTNKITSVGHADLIDDVDGKTWAVFLGCRPYEGNYYNTGRETFLLPVEWKKDIPQILPRGEKIAAIVEKENLSGGANTFSGNFFWRDDFDQDSPDMRWVMIRTPREKWYNLKKNNLELTALPTNIYTPDQPAFLGIRQQHTAFEVETEVDFTPESDLDIAGLVCYQNEEYNIVFGKTLQNGKQTLVVDRAEKGTVRIASLKISDEYIDSPIRLKISGNGKSYNFYASFSGKKWHPVLENVDGRNLSTESAGGFVGTIIGLYASSSSR